MIAGLDIGSYHELSILSDAVNIKLFRHATIDEVCGVHWFAGALNNASQSQGHCTDPHTYSFLDSATSLSRRHLVDDQTMRVSGQTSVKHERDDCVLLRSVDDLRHCTADGREGPLKLGYLREAMPTSKNNTTMVSIDWIPQIDSTKPARA
jgi:hypothetical protein